MTQPDKWDEIAEACVSEWKSRDRPTYEDIYGVIAAALRDAEKAGMERAAVICDEWEKERKAGARNETIEEDRGAMFAQAQGAWFVAKRIRAAKETKPDKPPDL
jgi:hypothetical protein